jgi:hypothetical protein
VDQGKVLPRGVRRHVIHLLLCFRLRHELLLSLVLRSTTYELESAPLLAPSSISPSRSN